MRFKHIKEDKYFRNDFMSFYYKLNLPMLSMEVSKYEDGEKRYKFRGTLTTILTILLLPFLFVSIWFIIPILPLALIGWGIIYTKHDREEYNYDTHKIYGFYFYNHNSNIIPVNLVIYRNKDGKRTTDHYDMPWNLEWMRTSLLLKNGDWYHETKGNYNDEIRASDDLWRERHLYSYILKTNEKQVTYANITVEEREWRPKWFKWTKLFRKVKRYIEVEFESDIGERYKSWKGGTIGCNYGMKENETPLECLRRMEKERVFN